MATDAAEPAPEWRQGTNGEFWEAVLPSGEFQEAEPRLIAERMQTAGECRICGRWVEQLWMAVLSLYVPPETQLRWLWGCTPNHAAAGAPRSWSELAEAFAVRGRLEDRDAAAFLADASPETRRVAVRIWLSWNGDFVMHPDDVALATAAILEPEQS